MDKTNMVTLLAKGLNEEIRMAKLKLYSLLLGKPVDEMTDNEAKIGYQLCIDDDIQQQLKKFMGDSPNK